MGSNGELVFSVDGGGTSSDVAIYDGAHEKIDEAHLGPLSLKSSDKDTVVESLAKAIALLDEYGERVETCVFALSGLDGEADIARMISLMISCGMLEEGAAIKKASFATVAEGVHGSSIILCSDALLPLFGMGLDRGSIVIAGTGSVSIHVDGQDGVKRYGGWGYAVSDSGSGTWIGMRYLSLALSACDRVQSALCHARNPKKKDIDLVNTSFGALFSESDETMAECGIEGRIRAIRQWSLSNDDPKAFAMLASRIMDGAYLGNDPICLKVVSKAAKRLAGLASLSYVEEEPDVVLAGGLFRNEMFARVVERRIIESCGTGAVVHVCRSEPAYGGIGIAAHLRGAL